MDNSLVIYMLRINNLPGYPICSAVQLAMGLLAAPLDRIADLFRKFRENTISPNPSIE